MTATIPLLAYSAIELLEVELIAFASHTPHASVALEFITPAVVKFGIVLHALP